MISARYIPNGLTLLRFSLIIPILLLIYLNKLSIALYLFIIAGLSDAVDGFLARRYHWSTRLGSIIDPAADKFLMISVFVMLACQNIVLWWAITIILIRDLIVVSGALIYHYLIGPYQFTPLLTSKMNTFVQLLLIVLILLMQSYINLFSLLHPVANLLLYYIIPFTNVISLVHYVVIWSVKATRRERLETV